MRKIFSFALVLVMLASLLVITVNAKDPYGTVVEAAYTEKLDGYALDDNTAVVFANGEVTYLACDYGFVPQIHKYGHSSSVLVTETPKDIVILK